MVFTFVNRKGGVGKTTLVINLASALVARGARTLLVDGDPQGNAAQWYRLKSTRIFDVEFCSDFTLTGSLNALAREFEYVIVDTPSGANHPIEAVLLETQLAIIPTGPSPLDIWSSKETVTLLRKIQKLNRHLDCRILITKKIPGTILARDAREAIGTLGFPVMRTEICQRVIYVESMICGLSVLEYMPKSKAAEEINLLCQEILLCAQPQPANARSIR